MYIRSHHAASGCACVTHCTSKCRQKLSRYIGGMASSARREGGWRSPERFYPLFAAPPSCAVCPPSRTPPCAKLTFERNSTTAILQIVLLPRHPDLAPGVTQLQRVQRAEPALVRLVATPKFPSLISVTSRSRPLLTAKFKLLWPIWKSGSSSLNGCPWLRISLPVHLGM